MNRILPPAIAATIIALFAISAITGAFTTTEKATIQAMKARLTALEADFATSQANDEAMAVDIDTLAANDATLNASVLALDAGLKGLVADDGPLAELNQMILDLDARIPAIVLTGIRPIVDCAATTCTVQVEWFSDPPATGQVEWGRTTDYGNTTRLEASALPYHKQTIGSFPADGKVYHFRVLAGDVASPSTGFVAAG